MPKSVHMLGTQNRMPALPWRSGTRHPPQRPLKPHILLITSDQQRTDSIRAYGRDEAHSPALDRLAASGVTFLSAYTSSPICVPARVSWLTGRHANVHQCGMSDLAEKHRRAALFTLGSCDFRKEATLPYLMRANGYRTIATGKAHYGIIATGKEHHVRYRPAQLFDVYLGQWDTGVNERANGAQGRISWDAALTPDHYVAKKPRASFPETLMMHAMVAALHKSMPTQPTFAWFSIESPHEPVWVPSDAAALMHRVMPPPLKLNDTLPVPHIALSSCKGLAQSHWRRDVGWRHIGAREMPLATNATKMLAIDWYRRAYYASAVANVDRPIAQLLAGIQAFRNRTLVVFTSDHGNMNWDHGWGAPPPLGDAKGIFYDASWRVPLIVSYPAMEPAPRGVKTHQLVSSIDVTATLLEAAGVSALGSSSGSSLQGISFYAQLRRGEHSPRHTVEVGRTKADGELRSAVAGYVADLRGTLGCGEAMAVVGRRFKLALYTGLAPGGENYRGTGRPTGMLFDLLRDPDESNDLFCASHVAHVRDALEEALLEWHAGQRRVRQSMDEVGGHTDSVGSAAMRAPDRKLERVVSVVESGCARAAQPYKACCNSGANCAAARPASATWISTLACAPPTTASSLSSATQSPQEAQRSRDAWSHRERAYKQAYLEVWHLELLHNQTRPQPGRSPPKGRDAIVRDARRAAALVANASTPWSSSLRAAAVRRVHSMV